MSEKSYKQQLRDIARSYSAEHESEYQLEDLVKWAIATSQWSLSRRDRFKIAREQFREALKDGKDETGCRIFIDAKVEQKQLWAHRQEASWPLRNRFLEEQARRAVDMRNAVLAMCNVLNAERKQDEPVFQVTFNWDDEEGQVA